MTNRLSIARLSIALLVAALSAAAQTGSSVEGRVLSTVQNQPVGKVVVTLRLDVQGSPAARSAAANLAKGPGRGGPVSDVWVCETAGDGRFHFLNVPPGNYVIRASHQGYLATLPGHIATEKDFPPVRLQAGQNVAGIDLRLTPTAAVAGRVVDNDGDPIRGGQVQLMRYAWVQGKKKLQQAEGGEIDDRGEYRLYNLAPGSYYIRAMPREAIRQMMRVTAQAPRSSAPVTGLSSSYYPDTSDPAAATELYLSPGAELKNIDIRVTAVRLHSIRGTYAVEAGAQVQVRAVNQSGEQGGNFVFMNALDTAYIVQDAIQSAQFAVQADVARLVQNAPSGPPPGTFEIDNLAPGKYTLIATQNKRIANRQDAQSQQLPLQARQAVEVLDHDVDGVSITFKPPVKISGTVAIEGAAGNAPTGANSNLFFQSDEADGNTGMARLKPDGSFEASLEPGVYHVRVANPQAQYLKAVKLGDKESPDKMLDTAQVSGPVRIVVSTEFGAIEGAVTDAEGKAVYSAFVTFIPDQEKPDWSDRYRTTMTDTRGHFSFVNLIPGGYRVYAWVGVENGAPASADFRKPFEAQAATVTIAAGANPNLDLKAIH